jgi:hypothetical protein
MAPSEMKRPAEGPGQIWHRREQKHRQRRGGGEQEGMLSTLLIQLAMRGK